MQMWTATAPTGINHREPVAPEPWRRRRVFTRGILADVKRHARDDDVALEEQRTLDEQRMLVVQQVMPPALRYELGKNDRYPRIPPRTPGPFDISEQRLEQRPIR